MRDLQRALTELLPSVASVTDATGVGGGCISQASRVRYLDDRGDSHDVFVKSNRASFVANFEAERDGLIRLREPNVIRVPRPIAVGTVGEQSWFVIEWIDQARRGRNYFRQFARQLADLHRATLGEEIGLCRDNFLGSAPQRNAPADSWAEFVATQRIGFQIGWAVDRGLADADLQKDCERIVDSIDRILEGREDRTSLLHGDLWSGNYLCGHDGEPVIVDPAVYHGCREAEFGMLLLFGSCGEGFYDEYQAALPMSGGWQRRTKVYVLYHLLNHLNLFGRGYHDQCVSLAAEILRE